MVTTLLPGLSSRVSAVITSLGPTRTGWRYADATDAAEIPNANIGDYIIDGPNIVQERALGTLRAIDIRKSYGNSQLITLGPGKKLLIRGGWYNYIYIENDQMIGADGNPVTITNYDGQVRWGGRPESTNQEHGLSIVGPRYFRFTGKYDAAAQTGDPAFRGHDAGYAFSQGKYGFWGTMNWLNMEYFIMGIGGNTAVASMSNFFEVDYIELSDGGFGVSLKWDYPPADKNEAMTYKWHDNYHHDMGGEGGYFGQNTNDRSHRMINCEVYNNRMIRVANEGLQMGNYAEGCDVHNNVFHQCGMRWKSPFEPYQDRGIQQSTSNGVVKFRRNTVVGCGEYFIVLANDNGLNRPPDHPVAGNDIEITENVFMFTRQRGGYIFGVSDQITGFKINDNWFFYFPDGTDAANIAYTSVYPGRTPDTKVWEVAVTDVPVAFRRNKFQTGLTFCPNPPANVVLDNNQSMPNPLQPQWINTGFPDGFNWRNPSQWSAKIGEMPGFPYTNPTTNKGQDNVFNAGDYAWHKSVCYRSKQNANAGRVPAGESDFWWELVLWNNGTRPPDDFRLKSEDIFNQLSIGLLDNEAPDTLTIPMDQGVFDFVMNEPEVFDPVEISIAAEEAGNNNMRLKIDYPANVMTSGGKIVAIGSSTLFGSGATAGNKLYELLQAWVAANISGGQFNVMAVPGTYSAYYVPDFEDPLSDWNRNVDAALAFDPHILIVSLPSNDPAFISNQAFLTNLIEIDEKAKAKGVYAFFTTTQPRNGYDAAQQQLLYDAADLIRKQFKTRAIDVFTGMAQPYTVDFPARMKPEYDSGDTIHPNNAGHAYIRDRIIATLQAFFVNKGYTKYMVERSLQQTTGYSLIQDNVVSNDILVPRVDGQLYYYRVRARRSNATFTAYSHPVSFQQPTYAGDILEETNFNFTRSANPEVYPGWNNLTPSGDIPNAGETFSGITNEAGQATTYGVRIDGDFENTTSGGGLAGVFPRDVIRSNWRVGNGSKSRITITGMDDAYLYDFQFLASQNVAAAPRYTGFTIGDRAKYLAANDATGPNNGITADILSVQSAAGEVTFIVRALPNSVLGYLNALTIRKRLNTGAVPMERGTFDFAFLEPLVIGGSTVTGQVRIALTGPAGLPTPNWNMLNLAAGESSQELLTADEGGGQNNSGMTLTIANMQPNAFDNGSAYGGSTLFPASVLRYVRYQSGNPGMIFRFGNLNPGRIYDISLMATRANNDAVVRYTVNAESKDISVNNNKDQVVKFESLTPNGSGVIEVTETWVSGGTAGFAYSSAIIVDIKLPSSPIPADQATFSFQLNEPDILMPQIPVDQQTFTFQLNEPSVKEVSGGAQVITTNTVYLGTERLGICLPPGFDPSKSYPLIVFLHGSGRTINTVLGEGWPLMLNQGDTADGLFISAFPGAPSGLTSWGIEVNGQMRPKWVYDYMVANFNIDINRVYYTGLSLGAAGSYLMAAAYPTLVTAFSAISGSKSQTYPWATIRNIPMDTMHGMLDQTQSTTNTIQAAGGLNALNPLPRVAPKTSLIWGQGHSGGVWHDRYYRRLNSPVAGNKATYDFHRWFLKYSKNAVQEGYGHVEYAELYKSWLNYNEAIKVVNVLSASADKSAMLARLATVKSTLFVKAWAIDIGSGSYLSAAPINNLTSMAANATASNLLDMDGGASAVSFRIPAIWATSEQILTYPVHAMGGHWGLPPQFFRDAAKVQTDVSTGSFEFGGLDNAKKYQVIVLHGFTWPNPDDINGRSEVTVTIGAASFTQFCQQNTWLTMTFDNITPVANKILGAVRALQNRTAGINGFILIEKP